jgi:nitroimidazol reductase NimA-like FMN-containing flavoprotein (pyridoxamine 5'-phosphate oxidase superfamily)
MTVEELTAYDIERMDEDAIRAFLSSHSEGVLGLPSEGAPTLRPMTYWYDGEDRLYFLYVVAGESRKRDLSAQAESARFLVYSTETAFIWRSVLCTGSLRQVSTDDSDAVRTILHDAPRPDVFEKVMAAERTAVYEFRIAAWTGLESTGLPPAFEAGASEDDGD